MPIEGLQAALDAIDESVGSLNTKVKAVYTQTLQRIVFDTPVHFKDGGRLRNNWFLTHQAPSVQTRGKNKRATAALNGIVKNMPDTVLGKTIYFTNNMPYVNVVEYGGYPNPPKQGTWTGSQYQALSIDGYSRHAASGMVRVNVSKAQKEIRQL